MSRENVELVERFLDRINADELDLALSYVDPDAVLDWSRSEAPDSGIHRGREAWGQWLSSRREELSGARFDARGADRPASRPGGAGGLHARRRASERSRGRGARGGDHPGA